MNFPDKNYLNQLLQNLKQKVEQTNPIEESLLMYSGAAMNWIADFVLDENVQWELKELLVDELYLTGTNPEWNKVIIEQAERSSEKLRQLIQGDANVNQLFANAHFDPAPILIRFDEDRYKVLDGMHRVVAAIRDNQRTISAFVGTVKGKLQPMCEPHVVYDLIKAYCRGLNKDREGLIAALNFLKSSYANVENLLQNRFNKDWVRDEEVQKIIKEVLNS